MSFGPGHSTTEHEGVSEFCPRCGDRTIGIIVECECGNRTYTCEVCDITFSMREIHRAKERETAI